MAQPRWHMKLNIIVCKAFFVIELKNLSQDSMGYVKLFSYIVDEAIEIRTGDTTCSNSFT